MLGMVVVDTWKASKVGEADSVSIKELSDILAKELMEEAEELEEKNKVCATVVDTVVACDFGNSTSVSSLPIAKACSSHTKVILKNGKQLRCLWCSRVNLVERKIILKCLECGRGFCRDENNGLSCWSHHVALGGIPGAPKRGTKKMKLCSMFEPP